MVAVVRPTAGGFSPWSLLVIAAAAALIVREFATRRVDVGTPPLPIALLTAIALTAMTGALSMITGWSAVSVRSAVMLIVACAFLVAAYLLLIETVRVGDLSASAPFRYTTVAGAVIVGLVFFGEVPDTFTIVGCTMIVLAGVAAAS